MTPDPVERALERARVNAGLEDTPTEEDSYGVQVLAAEVRRLRAIINVGFPWDSEARKTLRLALEVVEAARKLRNTDLPEVMTATEVGEMLMPVEVALTAFDAGRKL